MSVGEYLKTVRIKKNIQIQTVSKELHISFFYLNAIENDEFSKTPGGAFTIGYIRSYANYLNLDSNEIVNKFKTQVTLSEIPEPIELSKPVEVFYSPIKIISFFIIVSISITFYVLFIDKFNSQPEYAITPNIPEDLETIIEENEVKVALLKLKKDNNKEIIQQADIYNIKTSDDSKKVIKENQLLAIASKPTDLDKQELKSLISLKAIKPTWIQLRDINNQIIFSKLMDINDVYNYSINDEFIITTGNAGNVIVSIGGNVMGKLGKQGEVIDSINILPDYFSN